MSGEDQIAPEEQAAPVVPQRVEQADHVALVQAQGRQHSAALAVEAAQLRLQLAQRELAAAEAERAAVAKLIREKYAVSDEDQISADGAIWRKGADA